MLLWKVKILEEDSINEYEALLSGRTQSPDDNYLIREEVPLNDFTVIPGITADKGEERILKVLIF